jgi:glycosyltransferase involved in cell wall biosynthesis
LSNVASADSYVLVTAARNEASYIGRGIVSVLKQSILPKAWAIVSDGSSDDTDQIVRGFAERHAFIRLKRLDRCSGRSFASQAHALNAGVSMMADIDYTYIGMMDADITLEPCYYEEIIHRFQAEPDLGIAGGFIYEKKSGVFRSRIHNRTRSVPGAVQTFRRACLEHIGPFVPLRYGGLDTYAELRASFLGFRSRAFPDLRAFHHRRTGGADAPLAAFYKSGCMEFGIGYRLSYELMSCLSRAQMPPYFAGSVAKMIGYLVRFFRGDTPEVPLEMVRYLRKVQLERMLSVFQSPACRH